MKKLCKDCSTEIFADVNMVMVKNSLWKTICDNLEDDICDRCMEIRLGRKITEKDFLKPIKGQKIIPCNEYWLKNKDRQ